MVEFGSKVAVAKDFIHFFGFGTPVSSIVSIDCEQRKGRGRRGTLDMLPTLVREVVGGVKGTC